MLMFQSVLFLLSVLGSVESSENLTVFQEHSCGVKASASGLVVNGVETKPNEWPWLASLMIIPTRTFFCGGTIISENRVITAAHCIHNKRGRNFKRAEDVVAFLGRHHLYRYEKDSRVFWPKEILIHPDWSAFDARYDADLAVLISDQAIQFTSKIFPVCLWAFPIDDENVEGTVVGWGASEQTKRIEFEHTPRQVKVKRVPSLKCYQDFHHLASISTNRTFCAGGVTQNSGPCTGDSGGGFFVEIGNVWYIQGIVSASYLTSLKTCDVTKYSIFTKINEFKDWLKHDSKVFNIDIQCYIKLNPKSDGGFENDTTVVETDRDTNYEADAFVAPLPLCSALFSLTIQKPFTSLKTVGNQTFNEILSLRIDEQIMRHLPTNIGKVFPNLTSLIIHGTRLGFIERSNFEEMPNLKTIDLTKNQIEIIPRDAFYEVPKLEHIRLTDNNLSSIHEDLFVNNPKLRVLKTSGNSITSMSNGQFRNNRELNSLNLSGNKLLFISRENFKGLDKSLEQLYLKSNLMREIPFDSFHDLTNLKTIIVSRNLLTSLDEKTFVNNPSLQKFDASLNRIKYLRSDIFYHNSKLAWVSFRNNDIAVINRNVQLSVNINLNELQNSLKHFDMRSNPCTNLLYEQKSPLDKFIAKLFGNCDPIDPKH